MEEMVTIVVPWVGAGTEADPKKPDVANAPAGRGRRVMRYALTPDQPADPDAAKVLVIYSDNPAAIVTLNEFKRRAAMLWVRVSGASADVQAKWDRISTQLIPSFTEIDLTDQTVSAILGMAAQDGLLTQEEVARILTP